MSMNSVGYTNQTRGVVTNPEIKQCVKWAILKRPPFINDININMPC